MDGREGGGSRGALKDDREGREGWVEEEGVPHCEKSAVKEENETE